MSHDTPPIPDDRHRLLSAAARLAPMLAAAAPEIERARRLPQPVADALADEGLYSMLVPRSLGGGESDVHTFVQVIERLARSDAASAWCAFIANTTALIAGYLPPQAAREIFAGPGIKLAGVYAPHGRARPAEQDGVPGFIVSGTWPWGSGTANADWILGGCLVAGEEGVRSMVFKASQVTRADDWTAMGLCGTGSGRFSVTEAFVPRSRSASILADTPLAQPLYRFPIFCLLAVGIGAVSLGIARLAIDSLVELSAQKMPEGSRRMLAERASTQQHVARAEAGLRSARSFLLESIDAAWRAALAGGLPVELRRDLRLATTHAVEASAAVVQAMYACAGGNAIFESSPLQRCLRDIQVASQHTMVGEATWELTGRLFLGLSTQVAML